MRTAQTSRGAFTILNYRNRFPIFRPFFAHAKNSFSRILVAILRIVTTQVRYWGIENGANTNYEGLFNQYNFQFRNCNNQQYVSIESGLGFATGQGVRRCLGQDIPRRRVAELPKKGGPALPLAAEELSLRTHH
ncbi:hypothetical protein IF1G_08249 [Cordyceps javanica]|uniref:Uncharacterized protein n=1 Tax=Cordyceps javanica TaxID=43265 RepID=A0A545UU05_9HYPO|nr:hypothetical protein IF1G_08249 [Cordyceps javanica]